MAGGSSNAAKLGSLVEQQMREKYQLEIPENGRDSWRDAVDQAGNPWEIKGTQRERGDGQPPRLRIFEEPHQELRRFDGYYGFALYRIRGNGIQLLQTNSVRARAVRLQWGTSGHNSPNRSRQKMLPLERALRY
jgi:hypothetical protein